MSLKNTDLLKMIPLTSLTRLLLAARRNPKLGDNQISSGNIRALLRQLGPDASIKELKAMCAQFDRDRGRWVNR